jgi:hypothetical protein
VEQAQESTDIPKNIYTTMSATPDGWKHIHRRGRYRICVCREKNVGGASQGVVPAIMAERAGMFELDTVVALFLT